MGAPIFASEIVTCVAKELFERNGLVNGQIANNNIHTNDTDVAKGEERNRNFQRQRFALEVEVGCADEVAVAVIDFLSCAAKLVGLLSAKTFVAADDFFLSLQCKCLY